MLRALLDTLGYLFATHYSSIFSSTALHSYLSFIGVALAFPFLRMLMLLSKCIFHVLYATHLKSTSIDWLTLSAVSARFPGTGTINGDDFHAFRVPAKGNGDPGAGSDHFDIKI